ncbi:MAG: hypothetical protein WA210_10550 [Burkholderiaceae bacterium]
MRLHSLAAALACAGLFAACGGGSSSPSPATTGPVTLTGVVATGAALANASVTVKCSTGTGTATSSSSGAYTATITGGVLPCVLEATGGGNSLHSVATGSGTSATANITPLTELLVAQLSAQNPATFYQTNTATLATTVTTTTVATAQTAVVGTLSAAGVSTSSITNMVTDPLVASVGGTGGNAYDGVLVALQNTLTTAGTTLAQLTTAVATGAAGTAAGAPGTPATATDTASLPADLLLKPQASNCAALRSTTYRSFGFEPSSTTGPSDPVTSADTFVIDAANAAGPTITNSDGSIDNLTADPTDKCKFSWNPGPTPNVVTVSPAGVLVARIYDDVTLNYSVGMAFPLQTIPLSALAGTWNVLGWEGNAGVFGVSAGTVVVNSSGAVTSTRCFDPPDFINTIESNCITDTTLLPFFSARANDANGANGGFDLTSTDPADVFKDRGFAYRAGNGDLMMALLSADGSFNLITQYRTQNLPTVGNVTTRWNFDIDTALLANLPLAANTHTIISLDAAPGSFTRSTAPAGTTVSHPEHLARNIARNGYTHRTGETGVIASNGSTVNVREFYSMGLRGMGVTPVFLPANATNIDRFTISVDQP